jgi:hypothetical protein
MGDPRLNSIHLDNIRRQDFRRARDELLDARGTQTLYAELSQPPSASATFINQPVPGQTAPPLNLWLADREFIYPLKVGLNTLGRSSDNDLVVEELYISRRHCAILVHHDGSCLLQDMSSKNGTFLNGIKINGPTKLRTGDEIRICNRQFVFVAKNAPPSSGPPTNTIVE